MFVIGLGENCQSLQRIFHRCFQPRFDSFRQAVSEETTNKKCRWRPCLLTDQNKISNLYRGPSIHASNQVSFIQPSGFRGEFFLEISQSETRIVCGCHVCSRIGMKLSIYIQRTFHRSFLQSFGLFRKAVSEEKIFLEINQSETRISCGGNVFQRIGTI